MPRPLDQQIVVITGASSGIGRATAQHFVLEIAHDADFQDVVATVPAHRSTSVSVYDVFRPNGVRYYWRVVAANGLRSETRAFIAGTYDEAARAAEPDPARVSDARQAMDAVAPPALVAPPYLTGTSSSVQTATIVLVMILSFVVTISILIFASVGMG